MKLQQLRYVCEIVDRGMNVSRAAAALHTSQPGISKQIRMLEDELGVVLLERRSTRITGLTEAGTALLPTMRQMLQEGENLKRRAREAASPANAKLIIASTHTHARYVLPAMFKRFVERYPHVALQMRQTRTERIIELLRSGEADIGVTTEPVEPLDGIALAPCYRFGHSIVTGPGHPLLALRRRLTLDHLLRYPIITYDERFKLGRLVREEFEKRGLEPNIVVRAIDSDIAKAYVEAGFGVAVLMSIAYDRRDDEGLRALPVTHLFGEIVCYAMTLRERPLAAHAKHFIGLMQSVPVPGLMR
ncbi:MAG TPA: LysR substrate-binding domain-containing protein [Burkholderiales bacterium]|nr:LysR substrate-binding domain-containing protein [Burkholderiales bacterium]